MQKKKKHPQLHHPSMDCVMARRDTSYTQDDKAIGFFGLEHTTYREGWKGGGDVWGLGSEHHVLLCAQLSFYFTRSPSLCILHQTPVSCHSHWTPTGSHWSLKTSPSPFSDLCEFYSLLFCSYTCLCLGNCFTDGRLANAFTAITQKTTYYCM